MSALPLRTRALDAHRAKAAADWQTEREEAIRRSQHNRQQLAKALRTYLGMSEQEVADLFPIWPSSEDWLVLDGLRLFWQTADPYMDDWHPLGGSHGQLYACRVAPAWRCQRHNCSVPGYTGSHLDWVGLHSGTPDFDLVALGKWLAAEPQPAADGDTRCPLCNAEAKRNRQQQAPVLSPGERLVEALDRYLAWRARE